MKKLVILIFLLPLMVSCAAPPSPTSITIDRDIFKTRQWNIAVLDLNYKPAEKGSNGLVSYSSAANNAGEVIATMLASELSRIDNLRVVERGRIQDLISEQQMQMSGIISTSSAVEIGQLLGADAVVVGDVTDFLSWSSIAVVGSTVSFSMRMIDVESGRVISSGSASKVENYVVAFQNAQNLTRILVDDLSRQ